MTIRRSLKRMPRPPILADFRRQTKIGAQKGDGRGAGSPSRKGRRKRVWQPRRGETRNPRLSAGYSPRALQRARGGAP